MGTRSVSARLGSLISDFVDRGAQPGRKRGRVDQLQMIGGGAAAVVAALGSFSSGFDKLLAFVPAPLVSVVLAIVVLGACLAVVSAKEREPARIAFEREEQSPRLRYSYPPAPRQLAKVIAVVLLVLVLPRAVFALAMDWGGEVDLVVGRVSDRLTSEPIEGAVAVIVSADGDEVPAESRPSDSDSGTFIIDPELPVARDATLRLTHRDCAPVERKVRRGSNVPTDLAENLGLSVTDNPEWEEVAFYELEMDCPSS
jgi:hypothetical protein